MTEEIEVVDISEYHYDEPKKATEKRQESDWNTINEDTDTIVLSPEERQLTLIHPKNRGDMTEIKDFVDKDFAMSWLDDSEDSYINSIYADASENWRNMGFFRLGRRRYLRIKQRLYLKRSVNGKESQLQRAAGINFDATQNIPNQMQQLNQNMGPEEEKSGGIFGFLGKKK